MIDVYFPQTVKIHAWYNYLHYGFKKLQSENKINLIIKSEKIGVSPPIIPIEINGLIMYYDFSDFIPCVLNIKNTPYFKIQYHDSHKLIPNIFPIGQTVTSLKYFDVYQNKQEEIYDVIALFRATNYNLRCKCVELIKSQKWNSIVGVQNYRNRPKVPIGIEQPRLEYSEHLNKQLQSKICISLPGVGNYSSFWSWRTTEILGLGKCMLTVTPTCYLPNYPKNCWIECKSDLSDLIEKINYYLNNPIERNIIARNGKTYFDNYLSPTAMCQNIINKTLKYYEN